jgi:VanZ family protein
MTAGPLRAGSAPEFPRARHYGWLALGFLAFATYGSLVPLDFRPVGFAEAVERYRSAWLVPIRVESRSDWLSNILLFVPLGFLLAGWLTVDRPRAWSPAVALVAIPAASVLLSATIEYVQVYFPSRTVSSRDVVAETIGGAIGGALWLGFGSRLTGLARSRSASRGGRAAWLLPAYVLALLLSKAMPIDLTISPGELYHKYKEGMVALIPFAALASGTAGTVTRIADEAASFLVVGMLLALAGFPRLRTPLAVLAIGLVLAVSIEVGQLFVVSRRSDATDVIVGPLALLGGWVATRAIREGSNPNRARLVFGLTWLIPATCSSWFPFDFEGDWSAWLAKAAAVSPLPFADYYRGSVLGAADQIFRKVALFFPVGVAARGGSVGTLLLAGLLAIGFEAGQLALPGREPSLTDILVETAGAWAGQFAAWPGSARSRSRSVR